MAASSGAFEDEVIGKRQPPGRATVGAAEEETGGGVASKIGKGLLGIAKSKAMGSDGFTTLAMADVKPSKQSVNWFAVTFFIVCLLVMFISRH